MSIGSHIKMVHSFHGTTTAKLHHYCEPLYSGDTCMALKLAHHMLSEKVSAAVRSTRSDQKTACR